MLPENDHTVFIIAAREAGYNDAYYDGQYLPNLLSCQCERCVAEYSKSQAIALNDISAESGKYD